MKLQSFAENRWQRGAAEGVQLLSAVNGEEIALSSSEGLNFGAMAHYARTTGGANLRKYTFHQRANMLKALAKYLMEHKKEFYALSARTGATRTDSSASSGSLRWSRSRSMLSSSNSWISPTSAGRSSCSAPAPG